MDFFDGSEKKMLKKRLKRLKMVGTVEVGFFKWWALEELSNTATCAKQSIGFVFLFWTVNQGRARTQSPTTRNYAIEIPTFGEFARVSKARSAMAKPRRGWTTFVIMVSPLPGKYELELRVVEEHTQARKGLPDGFDSHWPLPRLRNNGLCVVPNDPLLSTHARWRWTGTS